MAGNPAIFEEEQDVIWMATGPFSIRPFLRCCPALLAVELFAKLISKVADSRAAHQDCRCPRAQVRNTHCATHRLSHHI